LSVWADGSWPSEHSKSSQKAQDRFCRIVFASTCRADRTPRRRRVRHEVQVVRFDDMDQGDLDFHVAGEYHAVGPLGVVFVDTFHLPQTRCVVKTKGPTEDHLSLLWLAT